MSRKRDHMIFLAGANARALGEVYIDAAIHLLDRQTFWESASTFWEAVVARARRDDSLEQLTLKAYRAEQTLNAIVAVSTVPPTQTEALAYTNAHRELLEARRRRDDACAHWNLP